MARYFTLIYQWKSAKKKRNSLKMLSNELQYILDEKEAYLSMKF